ncbi:MAG TPA: ribokinase [Candidatus Acutalibacter pullicola]|uniref:Ribokinase n=1 Tax=Candidatus Acutalibacter pullicola TaxID=2838417 RepID=A0A9D2SEX5_9FIRM|nr:ribokinase [Candidatus Acutalibacter pullicola]
MKQLLVIGSMNMDFVTHLDHMPAVGETILAQGLELVPGGKGANQAYAMGKLGGHATLLGAVGADSQGTKLCDNLASVGVDVSRVLHLGDAATGMAVIGVQPQGDNSIIVLPGANSRVTPDYIRQNLDVLEASDIVVLQLEIPLETVVYAAQTAKRLGKQVILDPAPAVAHLPEDLFPCLDLIKPNETELGILTGRPYEPARLREDALSLQAKGVRRVLVTLGGAGSYLLREDGSQEFFQADPHVTVVDTTAAGDSFVGALAVSLSRGRDLADAARFASRVADIVVSRPGAQSSIPYLEE